MQDTLLGRTGVRVSRLALGTATFGVAPQEHAIVRSLVLRTGAAHG